MFYENKEENQTSLWNTEENQHFYSIPETWITMCDDIKAKYRFQVVFKIRMFEASLLSGGAWELDLIALLKRHFKEERNTECRRRWSFVFAFIYLLLCFHFSFPAVNPYKRRSQVQQTSLLVDYSQFMKA